MLLTTEEALERVAQRTVDNTVDIRQKNKQRRHKVEDLYGVEYTRLGDSGAPARFYISISLDMVYIERFEFKLIIQPFVSTAGSGTSAAVVSVNDTRLEVEEALAEENEPHSHGIEPNPHRHSTEPHTHNIVAGITLIETTASDFLISIEGIDVTPYLMAQYGGEWIDGQGVYPSLEIGRNYDILEVACDLEAEGRHEDADKLVSPGYKSVEISSGAPFQVTLVNYLKYSHLNR